MSSMSVFNLLVLWLVLLFVQDTCGFFEPGSEVHVSVDGEVETSDSTDDCADHNSECTVWAEEGECSINPGWMLSEQGCPKACNVCPPEGFAFTQTHSGCINEHNQCDEWAALGECAANPGFMITECAKACQTCHLLDVALRCRPMPNRIAAVQAGDVNATFMRALAEFPDLKPRVLSRDPWVLVFDEFLSDTEVAAFVAQGHAQGFKRSSDAGRILPDGKFEVGEFRPMFVPPINEKSVFLLSSREPKAESPKFISPPSSSSPSRSPLFLPLGDT